MGPGNVLLLPGWRGSGADHWQTHWERRHGYRRVEQHDWTRPLRGDWVARVEDVVLSCDEPVVLVAHGLGCILVAAWAAHSGKTHRVRAALLVAPLDTQRAELREQLPSWSPVPLQRLPFRSVLLASRDDAHCSLERARLFAQAWGAQVLDYGACDQLDADPALAAWPTGHLVLQGLVTESRTDVEART